MKRISVLIPTRNRVKYLEESVNSFFKMAEKPEQVEVLIRMHRSDLLSLAWANSCQLPIRVIIGDDMEGYGSIQNFVNCLAACAYGDWLWAGSDDAKVVTPGWDNMLLVQSDHPKTECILANPSVFDMPDWRIPVLSRGLYEAIGTCGETVHGDCYIDALAHIAGIQRQIPVFMQKWDNLPWVTERARLDTWKEYRSEESARRFNLDKLKLGAVLGRELPKWTTSDAPVNP